MPIQPSVLAEPLEQDDSKADKRRKIDRLATGLGIINFVAWAGFAGTALVLPLTLAALGYLGQGWPGSVAALSLVVLGVILAAVSLVALMALSSGGFSSDDSFAKVAGRRLLVFGVCVLLPALILLGAATAASALPA